MTKKDLKNIIREVEDFPKQGIKFKDISTILGNPKAFHYVVDELAKSCEGATKIVSPDARGFLFGVPVALKLNVPFVMARKKNKLPGELISETYELEYGRDTLEIQKGSIVSGDRIAIIDDLLATGGTTSAIVKLTEKVGGIINNVSYVIELTGLNGSNKFSHTNVTSLVKYEF